MAKKLDPDGEDHSEEQDDAPVTREEFGRLMQRLDAQSKYMGRLEKLIKGNKSPAEDRSPQGDNGDNPPGLKEQVEQLAKEQAVIRQERDSLNQQKLVGSLSRVLQKKGVNALLAEDAAEVALTRNRDSFTLGSDGEATFTHNGESLTLDAWSSMFLATEKGKALTPVKTGPSRITLPKSGSKSGKQTTITSDQLARGEYDASVPLDEIVIAD
jgi:hypothetical protein